MFHERDSLDPSRRVIGQGTGRERYRASIRSVDTSSSQHAPPGPASRRKRSFPARSTSVNAIDDAFNRANSTMTISDGDR